MEKVRARWVGGYNGIIPGVGALNQGDEYLIYPQEAYGQTLLINPQNKADVTLIGFGHVVMPQHAGLSRAQLADIGYQFDVPSPSWEALEPFDPTRFASVPQDLPDEVDMSEFYHEPESEIAPEATSEEPPDIEAKKNEDGSISIITRLPPAPTTEVPAEEPPADS